MRKLDTQEQLSCAGGNFGWWDPDVIDPPRLLPVPYRPITNPRNPSRSPRPSRQPYRIELDTPVE